MIQKLTKNFNAMYQELANQKSNCFIAVLSKKLLNESHFEELFLDDMHFNISKGLNILIDIILSAVRPLAKVSKCAFDKND